MLGSNAPCPCWSVHCALTSVQQHPSIPARRRPCTSCTCCKRIETPTAPTTHRRRGCFRGVACTWGGPACACNTQHPNGATRTRTTNNSHRHTAYPRVHRISGEAAAADGGDAGASQQPRAASWEGRVGSCCMQRDTINSAPPHPAARVPTNLSHLCQTCHPVVANSLVPYIITCVGVCKQAIAAPPPPAKTRRLQSITGCRPPFALHATIRM